MQKEKAATAGLAIFETRLKQNEIVRITMIGNRLVRIRSAVIAMAVITMV